MTNKKHYDEASVIRSLMRKHSINISHDMGRPVIEIEKNATDVGNGSWGKIDYLVKYCDYVVMRVSHIRKRNLNINPSLTEEENTTPNINMASMVRNTMKKYKV